MDVPDLGEDFVTEKPVAERTSEKIVWLSTKESAERLGVTLRSLYRFIDEGTLTAYKFGRVIRLKEIDVGEFIESCRIEPGSLEHLYPDPKALARKTDQDESDQDESDQDEPDQVESGS